MPVAQHLPFFEYREAPAFFGEGEDYGGYFRDPDLPVSKLVRFPPRLRVVTAQRHGDADDTPQPDAERPVFTQRVAETEEYLFDLRDVLFAEDYVEEAAADVVRRSPQNAADLDVTNVQRTGDMVGFFLNGGQVGASYEVAVTAATYEGRGIVRSCIVRVVA